MHRLLTLITLLLCFSVQAENSSTGLYDQKHIKSISIVAPEWEDFTNRDGSGLYWELLKLIYEPEGIRLRHATVPWNRAMKMVTRYQVYSAIVGEYLDTEEPLIFPQFAIDVEYMSVLTRSERGLPWQGLDSLSGKNVGWIKGYDVLPEDQRDFVLVEYRTTAAGLELLADGRIDYMIDEWDEIAAAAAEKGEDMGRYTFNEMPDGTDVYVGFTDSPLSAIYIGIYDKRMRELYSSKQLQQLYEKYEAEIPESVIGKLAPANP
jgi:polar amino acid transport system substrate-binding protein